LKTKQVVQIQGMGCLLRKLFQFLFVKDDVTSGFILIPPDDFTAFHGAATGGALLFVFDGSMAESVQLVEADILGLGGSVHPHGDVHQAKGQRSLPHASHGYTPFFSSLIVLQLKYPCKSEQIWYPSEGNIDKARLLWKPSLLILIEIGEK
jgi:hypothetical protein